MVPEGEGVRARREQPLREARRDADAVRHVLGVDDAGVDLEALAQLGEELLDRVASGPSDDVADEEDPHRRPGSSGSDPTDG